MFVELPGRVVADDVVERVIRAVFVSVQCVTDCRRTTDVLRCGPHHLCTTRRKQPALQAELY